MTISFPNSRETRQSRPFIATGGNTEKKSETARSILDRQEKVRWQHGRTIGQRNREAVGIPMEAGMPEHPCEGIPTVPVVGRPGRDHKAFLLLLKAGLDGLPDSQSYQWFSLLAMIVVRTTSL